MDRWFDRSGLFVKMLASGLGTILAISALWMGASAYFLSKSNEAGELSRMANEVAVSLLDARDEDKNVLLRELDKPAFYTSQETEGVHVYREAMNTLRKSVAQLQSMPGADKETVKRIQDIVDAYDKYYTQVIGKYREMGFRDWGVRGEWNREGRRLNQLCVATGSAPMLQEANELLKVERSYIQTPDQKYYADIRDTIGRIKAKSGALAKEAQPAVREAADRYESAMERHWALRQEIGLTEDQGLLGKYRTAAFAAEPLAKQVREDANQTSLAAREHLTQANWVIMVLGVLLGGFIFFVLSRVISRPLLLATGVAERIAAGELLVDLGAIHERDVLGTALKTMVANLTDQVREIKEGAAVLGSSTAEISAAVTQVTASATETAAAVTQTMTTAEELRQTSELSAQKAGNVSKTAGESTALSAEGERALTEIVSAMDHIRRQMEAIGQSVIALSEQSQVIGEIIGTVDDLAEQSNILSVNASIEAAKAGEHGRGFAVVAQEIKSLAEKSKEGTGRVRSILADIQKATASAVMVTEQGSKAVARGVDQADAAGRSIRALAESIGNVDQAALQIMASSKQQQSGVEQVAAAIENIREATEQNVKSMEQLEATASALADIGRKIVDLVGWYKV